MAAAMGTVSAVGRGRERVVVHAVAPPPGQRSGVGQVGDKDERVCQLSRAKRDKRRRILSGRATRVKTDFAPS